MVGCWCFAARPGSPGAEAVVAKRASDGGPGGLAKGVRPDDDAENRDNALIGTAVAPAGAKPEPPPATEALGLAGEGSAAPLLGEGPAAGRSTSAVGDGDGGGGGGAQAAGDSTVEADGAGAAADGAVQEAEEPAIDRDSAARSSGAEPAAAAAAAEEPEAAAAAEASGRHSSPGEEGSQAALLPAEEVSLKQPRISRLSALFSCSSSGAVADGGERHSRPQVGPLDAPPLPSSPPLPDLCLPFVSGFSSGQLQPLPVTSTPTAEHTWRQWRQLRSLGRRAGPPAGAVLRVCGGGTGAAAARQAAAAGAV